MQYTIFMHHTYMCKYMYIYTCIFKYMWTYYMYNLLYVNLYIYVCMIQVLEFYHIAVLFSYFLRVPMLICFVLTGLILSTTRREQSFCFHTYLLIFFVFFLLFDSFLFSSFWARIFICISLSPETHYIYDIMHAHIELTQICLPSVGIKGMCLRYFFPW